MLIGVFDSGVGGLTVLRELEKELTGDSFLYFGDTARCPYGPKGNQTIIRYSIENSIFLIEQGVDCIVVACNTATSLALERLQKTFHVPVIGVIEPATKRALDVTKNGRIGVIGTKATIHSGVYQKQLKASLKDAHIVGHACPLFVPLVEEVSPNEAIIRLAVKDYLAPLKQERLDTLILGCTHYPLLAHYIQEECGPDIQIVDPAKEIADAVKKMKATTSAKSTKETAPRFCVSDDPDKFSEIANRFLGRALPHVEKVLISL